MLTAAHMAPKYAAHVAPNPATHIASKSAARKAPKSPTSQAAIVGRREIWDRQRRIRSLVGNQLLELRQEHGLTQAAVANAAGIDRSHLSRIERGSAKASIDSLVALAAVLGADASLRLFPTTGPRIRDRFQAPMVEAIVHRLDPRWSATPEYPVPAARGVIDLVVRLRGGGLVIACEVHSELRSVELVLRRLAEKADGLSLASAPGTSVSSVLVVRSTARTRAVVRAFSATFRARFQASPRAALEALGGAEAAWPGAALLWATVERGRAELLVRSPHGLAFQAEGRGARRDRRGA